MKTAMIIATFVTAFNDNDPLVPEVWAQEALMILENNMVYGNLVYRDFEDKIAEYGDVVNAHRPGTFEMKRKTDDDEVDTQTASSTKVPVPLDQWLHISFIIKDGELSKGFTNLLNYHLRPALIAHAEGVDQIIAGQVYQFLGNCVGKLGTGVGKSTLVAAREKANDLKIPMNGRILALSSASEGDVLDTDALVKANEVGDAGLAVKQAILGMRFGMNILMAQNTPSIVAGNTTTAGAVNLSAGYAAGTTVIACDGFGAGECAAGWWVTIAGDMTPQFVTAVNNATPTQLTVSPGLRSAVANDAVITAYAPGAVDLVAGYAAGYAKAIAHDGFTVAPKRGQLVSFGTSASAARYAAIGTPTTTATMLDRPLAALLANDTLMGIGPAGNYNMLFHRDAIGLVSRPLAAPMPGTGARAYVAVYNGMAVRVVITYDGKAQGHRVTVDNLLGVAVLNSNLAVPVLG
jgi:hypothetical protein